MTARPLIIPGAMPSRDANGRALTALLRFYAPGTSTLKAVYSASDLVTSLAQPIASDAAGRWPAMWADDAQSFDVGWSDATFDQTIKTFANVSPANDAVLSSAAMAQASADDAAASAAAVAAVAAELTDIAAGDFGGLSLTNVTQITLLTAPAVDMHAATKKYVDDTAFAAAAGQLPGQVGNAGKVLTTNGSVISWGSITKATIGLSNVDNTAVLGKQSIWIPASAMVPRTTSGAAYGTLETATNKVNVRTLDFDASAVENAQFAVRLPKSWNEGTVSFVPLWSHAATTVNFGAVFELQAVAISDGDLLDVAFGTAVGSTDTGGVTDKLYVGPESAAITIAGTPQPEDWVVFQIRRAVADAGDTLAIDTRLHGLTLYITTDAGTDA